jgi:hypothetical protein
MIPGGTIFNYNNDPIEIVSKIDKYRIPKESPTRQD